GTGAVTLVFENSGYEPADVSFIIDDQDIGRHDLYLRQASTGLVWWLVPEAASPSFAGRGSVIRTMAPRPPAATAGESSRSSCPPCSSMILLTMARPRPVPFSRVVM